MRRSVDEWVEISSIIDVIANEYPSDGYTGEVIGGIIGVVIGAFTPLGPEIGGILGVLAGHQLEKAEKATNTDLQEFADLMNAVANDTDASEDGMISGGTEYKFEITVINVYDSNGELVYTHEIYTFSVYVNGEWMSMTFDSEEAYFRATQEFIKRGFEPYMEITTINENRKKETDPQ
jgi:hypothetical protein